MSTTEIMFRINETDTIASDPLALLSLINPVQGHEFLVCRETGRDGDNPHYHGIATIDCTMPTLRKRLQRAGLSGNEAYSIKKIVESKRPAYLRYLCKGTGTGAEDGPEIRHQEGFTDDQIAALYKEYWVENQVLCEERAKKRQRTQSAGVLLLEICKQKGLRTKEEIAREIYNWYLINKTSAPIFQIKSVFAWVMSHMNENFHQLMIEKIMEI